MRTVLGKHYGSSNVICGRLGLPKEPRLKAQQPKGGSLLPTLHIFVRWPSRLWFVIRLAGSHLEGKWITRGGRDVKVPPLPLAMPVATGTLSLAKRT